VSGTPSSGGGAGFSALRVLVVDDDEFILDVTSELLQQLGVPTVECAVNGQAALDAMASASRPWDMLVCDLTMPRMDGITFLRHLAEQEFTGGVLLVSGADKRLADTVGYLALQLNLRFLGAAQKPITEVALRDALDALSAQTPGDNLRAPPRPLSVDVIRAGLAAGTGLETFFQPKVSVHENRVVGAECLARWRTEEGDLISPLAFIPVAEANGLIDALTHAVFRQAMTHHGEWLSQGHAFKVSVNVSMDNLSQLDLPDAWAQTARQAGVDPSGVVLEMTEGSLMRDLTTALEVLTRLRLKGFHLSIDDFGTGYSSLSKLKLLPFTELKVDRAFVFGAVTDSVARAILESSVRLGHSLDMQVVAEGAESQEEFELVRAAGCDEVQGYFIAKPMPAHEFIEWKVQWEARSQDPARSAGQPSA